MLAAQVRGGRGGRCKGRAAPHRSAGSAITAPASWPRPERSNPQTWPRGGLDAALSSTGSSSSDVARVGPGAGGTAGIAQAVDFCFRAAIRMAMSFQDVCSGFPLATAQPAAAPAPTGAQPARCVPTRRRSSGARHGRGPCVGRARLGGIRRVRRFLGRTVMMPSIMNGSVSLAGFRRSAV